VKYLPLLAAGMVALPAAATNVPMNSVVLGGLDKVTGRVQTLEARVGQPITFGTLQIVARTCLSHPPEEPPESSAFLEISPLAAKNPGKEGVGKEGAALFSGWMFASSPAISAMDHPIYDVWVLRCENKSASNSR
jgi:hypothetical protein